MNKIKFRCSSLSDIMTNARSKSESALSETAKTQCLKTFLAFKYGYYEDIHTDGIMKGRLLESSAIGILSEYENVFLKKNTERRTNDFITGECDVIGKNNVIYDIKISENLRTFFEVEDVSKNYYCQAQGYMELWQIPNYKLTYVLMPDTDEMIERKISRLSFHLVGEDFEKAKDQIIRNNEIIHQMTIDERIKIFNIEYNIDDILSLYDRIEVCREYIKEKFSFG